MFFQQYTKSVYTAFLQKSGSYVDIQSECHSLEMIWPFMWYSLQLKWIQFIIIHLEMHPCAQLSAFADNMWLAFPSFMSFEMKIMLTGNASKGETPTLSDTYCHPVCRNFVTQMLFNFIIDSTGSPYLVAQGWWNRSGILWNQSSPWRKYAISPGN